MEVKACGKVHPDGVPCTKSVFYEKHCCIDKVYDHPGPHEHLDKPLEEGGRITHRWEEVLQIVDLPYDAYRAWTEEDIKAAEEQAQQEAMAR
jgi:hypothetical protein